MLQHMLGSTGDFKI